MPAPAATPAKAAASEAELAQAADLLNAADRVTILVGGGMRGQGAALQALAEALDAPVIQTTNARGMMHGHPLVVPASPSLDATRDALRGADRILALGTELGLTEIDMYVRGGFPDTSDMIRVDVCADQLARHPAALAIRADAGGFARALLPRLAPKAGDGRQRAEAARVAARTEMGVLEPLMPARLAMLEVIRTAMPGALIVGDSTQPIYAGNLYYDHDRPGGYFNAATGFGALGFGPGAAVGAAVAAPGVPVVCLIGDGGLQFSPGELRTAVDERLPITFLVWNNAAFREIADAMRGANTEVIGCSPSPLNLEPFAAACDLPFLSVPQEPEMLDWALRQPCEGPRLIEVRVSD